MSGNPEIKVYLSVCGEKQVLLRDELAFVLQRAGMQVIPAENPKDPSTLAGYSTSLTQANCSVHVLFPEYGPMVEDRLSLAKHQLQEARKIQEADPKFKIIVWLPHTTTLTNTDVEQHNFINEVRNSISKNMVFNNAASPIHLVDDIRSLMAVTEKEVFATNSTDIFLISNQLDENEANDIIDMLSDIIPVEKLSIVQDSDMDYSEFCSQQIGKSKLAVVYFKESGDWAIPFAQQVWKKIGGASSHTPILVIGDEDPDTNMNKKLRAPKVISLIISGELIPLEIKVQFDKVVEAK
ncbi:MAG: hypothetical protein ACXVC6_02745 [Bacteroidia bacterium]